MLRRPATLLQACLYGSGSRVPKNICCKCGYALDGLAPPLPESAPRELNCPECGAPVELREHWTTDGRHSLRSLLIASCCAAVAIVALVTSDACILRSIADADPSSNHAIMLVIVGRAAMYLGPMVGAILAGFAMRGTLAQHHAVRRFLFVFVPCGVAMLASQAIWRWMLSG